MLAVRIAARTTSGFLCARTKPLHQIGLIAGNGEADDWRTVAVKVFERRTGILAKPWHFTEIETKRNRKGESQRLPVVYACIYLDNELLFRALRARGNNGKNILEVADGQLETITGFEPAHRLFCSENAATLRQLYRVPGRVME